MHAVPSVRPSSGGQALLLPSHNSAASQGLEISRHTVPAGFTPMGMHCACPSRQAISPTSHGLPVSQNAPAMQSEFPASTGAASATGSSASTAPSENTMLSVGTPPSSEWVLLSSQAPAIIPTPKHSAMIQVRSRTRISNLILPILQNISDDLPLHRIGPLSYRMQHWLLCRLAQRLLCIPLSVSTPSGICHTGRALLP
jgi:hypothetical protein